MNDCRRSLCLAGASLAAALHLGCAEIVGADFDVHPACETCPVVVADGLDHPKSVAVADGFVFWVESRDVGRVMKIPLSGGDPIVVSDGDLGPNQITARDGYVYWTDTALKESEVRRAPTQGGPVEVIAPNQVLAIGIAVDDNNVYWTEQGTSTVRVASLKSLPSEGTPLSMPFASPSLVIADESDLFVSGLSPAPDGGIHRVRKLGGETTRIVESPNANAVALIGDLVCWTTYFNGTGEDKIGCAGKDGSGPIELAGERDAPTGIVADETRLYWGELGPGAVFQGEPFGAPKLLADGQSGPNGLTVDGDTLYWANFSDSGSIMKLKVR